MRVVCIDKEAWPKGATGEIKGGVIKEGCVYDVLQVHSMEGYTWYELKVDPGLAYWEKCFAPLSTIDETEMERNYKTELV